MKKMILLLLALPLVLVSCSDKGDDGNLQGLWEAKVKSSDVDLRMQIGQSIDFNKDLVTESLFYKFNSGSLETNRSKDYNINDFSIEKEIGVYTANEGVLKLYINEHSCANVLKAPPRKLERTLPYTISKDFKTMTVTFPPNNKVVFTKLEGTAGDNTETAINSSDVGCFDANDKKFVKNKVQKPNDVTAVDLKAKRDELAAKAAQEAQATEETETQEATAE